MANGRHTRTVAHLTSPLCSAADRADFAIAERIVNRIKTRQTFDPDWEGYAIFEVYLGLVAVRMIQVLK
jgi:hypothetical protein